MRSRNEINTGAAVLWASAFIITAMIIVQAGRLQGNAAYADQAVSQGEYSMVTVNAGRGGGDTPYDVLFVLDSRDETLLIYDVEDARRGGVLLRAGGSLANVFAAARR